MALITCRELSVGYEGNPIRKDISFIQEEGEYLVIVGENGAGKTTLLRTILGLQKPMGGELKLNDRLTGGGIGYLPQRVTVRKDFPATVREVVLCGCRTKGWGIPGYSRKEKACAMENLSRVRMEEYAGRRLWELSGGQLQRVLLARALCAANGLLAMDEPVSGLDPEATDEMYQLVQRINREEGMAILMISHDLPQVLEYAERVLWVGEKTLQITVEEFRRMEGPRI